MEIEEIVPEPEPTTYVLRLDAQEMRALVHAVDMTTYIGREHGLLRAQKETYGDDPAGLSVKLWDLYRALPRISRTGKPF